MKFKSPQLTAMSYPVCPCETLSLYAADFAKLYEVLKIGLQLNKRHYCKAISLTWKTPKSRCEAWELMLRTTKYTTRPQSKSLRLK